ncbi:MAG: GAF domain-containing protein, partial [Candidatus Aquicultor sp.]|nr:GAF domain-containing protein [Candidatus Aquicultor sp.]
MKSLMDTQNSETIKLGGRFYRSRHFWFVVLAVLVLAAYSASEHLAPKLSILGFSSALFRDTFERSFFIIPVIYATVVFRLRGGFTTLAASLAIVAPEFYMTQPRFIGFAVQMVAAGSIASAAILFVNYHLNQRDRLKLTVERLDVAHEKLHQKVRSSIEQEHRLAALTSFSATLNESLDIEQIIDTAVNMVKEIMFVEVVLLFTLDEAAKELRIAAFEGVNQKYAEAVDHMRLGDGFCGRVAKTGQPLIIEDTLTDTKLTKPEAK